MIVRRQFLQGIATGAALSVGAGSGVRAQGLGTDYDVIIIGAGVAGLAVSEHLAGLDSDLKVLVLEARDRIGGRIHSIRHEDLTRHAELGALYLLHDDGADWSVVRDLDLNVETLAGERLTLYPGMADLVRGLSEASSGRVQLSSEVTDVFWREGLVGVNYLNRGLSSAVTARRLVITIPAGVLRAGGPVITPSLSDAKQQVLGSIGSDQILSCAMVFRAGDAVLKDDAREWTRETDTSSLRAFVAGPLGEVLLEAQYRGGRAEALAGQGEDLLMALSLRDFGEALEKPPALASAVWRSGADWGRDPFSRGARSLASSTSDHLVLAESMNNTLFFAGEATADPAVVGTVHGAYASGKRAGREVAASFGSELLTSDPNEPILELL